MATLHLLLASLALLTAGNHPTMKSDLPPSSQDSYVPFEGEKSTWHDGFERFDYLMDPETLQISPYKRPEAEGFGVSGLLDGKSRCVVVCPKHPAPGNPWSWQGCYWDHQSQAEVELLRRGFHIAYVSADGEHGPDKRWEAWYEYLTKRHGLSRRPAFVGMSRGGLYELRWATTHPDRVCGIYADNPAADDEIFRKLPELARADVPILFVCGTNDPLLPQHALPMEAIYQQFGGRASMMLKDGAGHHPHSLRDPKPIADFLEASAQEKTPPVPDFVAGNRFERSNYYGIESRYAKFPEDGYFITTRGAAFTEVYDRYRVWPGMDQPTTILVPKKEAPGRPWVLRSSYVERDAMVDRALLARGFHIVVGPVGYNADGPSLADWNKVYAYLRGHGFAAKAVLEGTGGGAGSVYGWAVENPEKVACVYAKNAIMAAPGFEKQPLDHLDALAKAGVSLLHDGGEPVEERYRALKGEITVLHGASVEEVVEFVAKHSR